MGCKLLFITIFISTIHISTMKKKSVLKKCNGWREMIELATSIHYRIVTPAGESSGFIEDIQIYYETLEKVMDGLQRNDTTSLDSYLNIRAAQGPAHLQGYPVRTVRLEEFFEWDVFTTWQFRGLMKYTWLLWRDINSYMKEHGNDSSLFA